MILTTVQLRRASCVMDTLAPQVLIYNNVNNNNNNIDNENVKKWANCVMDTLVPHALICKNLTRNSNNNNNIVNNKNNKGKKIMDTLVTQVPTLNLIVFCFVCKLGTEEQKFCNCRVYFVTFL